MTDSRIHIRMNRSTGELELDGPPELVAEWWEKLWPEFSGGSPVPPPLTQKALLLPATGQGQVQLPMVFGEFFTGFRSDVTDVDKVLIAGAFAQEHEQDRTFTTKVANQHLIDQNIKVANASENVRRLIQTKRAFVVSTGKYRVSATGFEHLKTLQVNNS